MIKNRVEAVLAGNRIPVQVNVVPIKDGSLVFVPAKVPEVVQSQLLHSTGASQVDILTQGDNSMIVLKGVK